MSRNPLKIIIPALTTFIFSLFFIIVAVNVILLSRFLRKILEDLINRYGRENIVKISLQGNIKGLLDLFLLRMREKKKAREDTTQS
ncbi:MAG: hypothetical protein ACFFCS_09870 [Candidatus Hodarchaeota archaeon]